MLRTNTLQAFDLISDDVISEIGHLTQQLEGFVSHPERTDSLVAALNHINKLKGIFTILDANGPLILINEIMEVAEQLLNAKKSRKRHLECLSIALLRLQRYLEHVGRKSDEMPELLLPVINRLRTQLEKPALPESHFFQVNLDKRRMDSPIAFDKNEQSSKSRYYRKMYHVGLIEVLRQRCVVGGLKMMQRALQSLDNGMRLNTSLDLWWICDVLMDSFITRKLQLTRQRLKIFSRIDSQIRQLDHKVPVASETHAVKAIELTTEVIYLCSISHSEDRSRSKLIQHFGLDEPTIKESQLRAERDEFNGPSESDFSAITESLMTEITEIESLTAQLSDKVIQTKLQNQVYAKMQNLKKMLFVLKEETQTIRLSMGINLLKDSIDCRCPVPNKDIEFLRVVIENITSAINESQLESNLGNKDTRRSRLSDEMEIIRKDAHSSIKNIMEIISNFVANNRKTLLLKGVLEHLDKAQDHFQSLKVTRAAQQVASCKQYFINHLQQNPKSTPEEAIHYFADTIGGLEFFLDTMAFSSVPSDETLDFIDSSLSSLRKTNT